MKSLEKLLNESLLDDEDIQIGDETAVNNITIEDWCKIHLKHFDKYGGEIRNGKIYFKNFKHTFGSTICINLDANGIIPDFIKWGDVSQIDFIVGEDVNIKSFKNFPSIFKSLMIDTVKLPRDFTSWEEEIQCDELSFTSKQSLNGLRGNIKYLAITADKLKSFDCPDLNVDIFNCYWDKKYNLKSFDNLPKINEFNIDSTPAVEKYIKQHDIEIKKPNKITWKILTSNLSNYSIIAHYLNK